ncbi:MAG: ethylbenzene dehydrogenase, partial [Chloroflexi bacterium]|nr:ethylbenzene dehydrogenase [Chloroflexota bacterium]
ATKTVADKTKPGFMLPLGSAKDGSPGFILDGEKVPFDDAQFVAGDRIPAIIKSTIVGDRGDITAGWKWANGAWTLEFGRKLVTGSETDVQFSDLAATYYFGVAVFENAQVRHAYETGASPFVFKP